MHHRSTVIIGIVGTAFAVASLAAQGTSAVAKMHEHLSAVTTIDYAVIRGDVEDAAEAAKALVAGLSAEGLPAGAEKYIVEVRAAANAVAAATDLKAAGAGAANLQASCGNCHTGLGHALKQVTVPKPPEVISTKTRMREHAWSIDALAKGLQGPANDFWNAGANTMKKARVIKVQLKDPQLSQEVNAAEEQYRAIGDKARDAKDQAARAAVYGEILVTCGHCHSLQGRVFGPAPK